jgi:hypothetical protein
MEKELETAITQAVSDMRPLRAVTPRQTTVTEQWKRLKTIERDLRERIARERVDIMADHERKWTEIHSDNARRKSDALAKLDRDLEDNKTVLIAETQSKLREHDMLLKQL